MIESEGGRWRCECKKEGASEVTVDKTAEVLGGCVAAGCVEAVPVSGGEVVEKYEHH